MRRSTSLSTRIYKPKVFTILILLIVLTGGFLRFSHLPDKLVWFDESFTRLRISGRDEHDNANPALFTGLPIPTTAFEPFQQARPGSSWRGTVRSLARKAPQHPPLYFLLARFNSLVLGDSLLGMRSVSALCGTLAVPAMVLLGLELSGDRSISLLAGAMAAVSPLWIRFAQDGRPYSLWLLLVILGHVAYLRLVRQPGRTAALAYGVVMGLALFTQLLSILTLLAHGLHLILSGAVRRRPIPRSYLGATTLALLIASPWAVVLALNRSTAFATSRHLLRPKAPGELLQHGLDNLNTLFSAWPRVHGPLGPVVSLLPLLAVVALLLATIRRRSFEQGLFVVLISMVPVLPFFAADLLLGGQRSVQVKYLLPGSIGVFLALGRWLVLQSRLRIVQGLTACLLSLALASSLVMLTSPTWWGRSQVDVDLGNLLRSADRPQIVADGSFGVLAMLSHQLRGHGSFVLTRSPQTLGLQPHEGERFAYQPSDELKEALTTRMGCRLERVYAKQREGETLYVLYRITACPHLPIK
jgi:uncharacterized membrane protein